MTLDQPNKLVRQAGRDHGVVCLHALRPLVVAQAQRPAARGKQDRPTIPFEQCSVPSHVIPKVTFLTSYRVRR